MIIWSDFLKNIPTGAAGRLKRPFFDPKHDLAPFRIQAYFDWLTFDSKVNLH